ncbi:MAG: CAP domain-containing protein [Actinomycetota bacterium]|nr:CAP domain-containing protein [Actinomycetota bacterium]
MISRYVMMVLLATLLAAVTAVGATAAETKETGVKRATARDAEVGAVSVQSCTGGDVSLSADEKRMFELHNKTRADRGLSRLCVHPALQKAARAYSQEMISKDYFKHGDVSKRLSKSGYRWSTYGENILYDPGSQDSTESLFKLWMKSSGHKSNILNKDFREAGIGASSGSYKDGKAIMWTVDFGDR